MPWRIGGWASSQGGWVRATCRSLCADGHVRSPAQLAHVLCIFSLFHLCCLSFLGQTLLTRSLTGLVVGVRDTRDHGRYVGEIRRPAARSGTELQRLARELPAQCSCEPTGGQQARSQRAIRARNCIHIAALHPRCPLANFRASGHASRPR
jgi:hypothetical protein